MLRPHRESDLFREEQMEGGTPLDTFLELGVPSHLLPWCKPRNFPDEAQRLLEGLRDSNYPVFNPNRRLPVEVFTGDEADGHVVSHVAAIFMANRMRDEHRRPFHRSVSGPPAGIAHLAVVRLVPVDVVESLYHPGSPLLGVRPLQGPDDPCGVEVGIGTLAITGVRSPRTLLTHYPRAAMCLRRRGHEGLPTYVVVDMLEDPDGQDLAEAIPGLVTLTRT